MNVAFDAGPYPETNLGTFTMPLYGIASGAMGDTRAQPHRPPMS